MMKKHVLNIDQKSQNFGTFLVFLVTKSAATAFPWHLHYFNRRESTFWAKIRQKLFTLKLFSAFYFRPIFLLITVFWEILTSSAFFDPIF